MTTPFRALLLSALVVASAHADTSSSGEEDVCGLNGDDEDDAETVEDADEIDEDDRVINCGNCGACSNSNDIANYEQDFLFDFPCAITLIFAKYTYLAAVYGDSLASDWDAAVIEAADAVGRAEADTCLKESQLLANPFTDPCRECWTEAVTCTPSEPCTVVTGLITVAPNTIIPVFDLTSPCGAVGDAVYNGDQLDQIDQGALFACLACDARECEPDFLKCAGANRRRTGQSSSSLSPIQALYSQPTCDVLL